MKVPNKKYASIRILSTVITATVQKEKDVKKKIVINIKDTGSHIK